MTREVHLSLAGDMRFRAHTGSGHDLLLDAGGDSAEGGGDNSGPSPVELVLVALGGCGAMDVVAILRKMRQNVTAYDVSVAGERSEEHPKVFTRITMTHAIAGNAVQEDNVRRAITLSMTRYCPVFAMLAPSVPIHVRYAISDAAGAQLSAGEVTFPDPPATEATER